MQQIAGVDIGYGYTKVESQAAEGMFFPSVVGRAVEVRYKTDLARNGHPTFYQKFSVAGSDWYVGGYAMLQSPEVMTPLARGRTNSQVLDVLHLAGLYLAGLQGDVYLATGLPVRWYSDAEELRRRLTSMPAFQVNGKWQEIAVQDVVVMPQPFGSLFYTILDQGGYIQPERSRWAMGRIAILDIGTYTTDYVLTEGMTYIEAGSGSVTNAMAEVLDAVAAHIEADHGLALPRHQVDANVRAGAFRVFGQSHSTEPYLTPALDQTWEAIRAKALELWEDGRQIDTVLLTGGGAHWFRDRAQELYPHARVVDGEPARANALGFLRYAARKFGKP